jgi:hypothetical protein
LIFCVSALPVFCTTTFGSSDPIRYYLWVIPLALFWVARSLERRAGNQGRPDMEARIPG